MGVKQEQDFIKLIIIIFIIFHKHDDTKQWIIYLVETDMVLYTMWHKDHDSPAEFVKLLYAHVDTIIAADVRSRFHHNLYKYTLTSKYKAKTITY